MNGSVFVSHNHLDKPIARRVARRLHAYGISTWLDESELRLGSELAPTIQQHINAASVVVVIATRSAAASPWVQRELAFARAATRGITICPLFIEDVKSDPVFTEYLGLEASDTHELERKIQTLAEAVTGSPVAAPSPQRLKEALRAVEAEEPELTPLVEGCLEGEGVHSAQIDTVANVSFHNLDFTINALYDILPGANRIVFAAAMYFARRGAGKYALEKHIVERQEHDVVISVAVGAKLAKEDLDAALNLLSKCSPPDDQALAGFLDKSGEALNASQRVTAVRLVTFPFRPPKGFAAYAAFAAMRLMPESEDLKRLWQWWIRDGLFDTDPDTLARFFFEALSEALPGWEEIVEEFLSHVRHLARSRDRNKVRMTVEHLKGAAKHGSQLQNSPLQRRISQEISSARGAAEWDGWAEAEEMSMYVEFMVKAADTDRNFGKANLDYKSHWKAIKELESELDKPGVEQGNRDKSDSGSKE
jgi:hypothetical protein